MNDRFSEHFRIDQYLRNKSQQTSKTKLLKRNENILSNFPVGLIIITKEDVKLEDRVEFINQYACKLFKVRETVNVKALKEKFNQFVKLKSNNNNTKANKTLYDIIFSYSSSNLELDNFIPFECTYSNSVILYIKINEINSEKYIVIDKYDKYNEERKNIELNLIKTINYQYLHTLYHELNNPLNALLAISGEKERANIFSSEITNSKVDDKPIQPKKSVIKKRRSNTILNLKNNNRMGLGQELFDKNFKKKNTIEDVYLNDKIPLLVNIIKIFIKNFILYLKIKTDSVLNHKKKHPNDTSDIMSAVELSEYEKELTKNQRVKINLEYVLDLYLEKFVCLFNYKEIDYETNFEKLRDVYVITDEFHFTYYIRQIYTFLYYIVPKKEGFIFEYEKGTEYNTIKIIIRKKNNGDTSKRTVDPIGLLNYKENKISKDSRDDVSQVIQTKEMTKEVLYALSKKLCFVLEIYDYETFDKNNKNVYLCITMPIQMKDKSEEEDEFKDNDINEMIQTNSYLLENKLKRQLPTCEGFERKKSNYSFNYESSIGNQIIEINTKNIKNGTPKNFKKSEQKLNNLNINLKKESQNKVVLYHKLNDKHNFLKRCLKISKNRKKEKSSCKYNSNNNYKRKSLNIVNLNNSRKMKSNFKINLSQKNLYSTMSQKNNLKLKDAQLSGVFTKINNFGLSEELDCNDLSISNISGNNKNTKKDVMLMKKANPKISSKSNQIKDTQKRPSNFNLEMNDRTQLSTNNKSPTNRIKHSKLKSSYIITDVIEGENKNINISINNNNIINIINDNSNNNNNNTDNNNDGNHQEKKIQDFISNTKIESQNGDTNNGNMKFPELDKNRPKRFSQNASPKINPKDCMTFFNEEKKEGVSKDKNTFVNESIKQNKSLFLEANKEREFNLHSESNHNNNNNISNVNILEEEEEEEEDDEKEDNNCNCLDILIVDDEEFNVMASQKMIKNLGYETDKAYNGQECIDLIKEKQKLNCKCNKNYYKIIFLDIVMPVLDGIKAAKKIQEMIDNKEINENTQIVFVSGNIDGNDLKNSLLQINCVKECLQKPVKIDRYQKIIEKYYKNN